MGWIFSLAFFFVAVFNPDVNSDVFYVSSALFAIAGAIGNKAGKQLVINMDEKKK